MEKLEVTFRIVTPMFLGGADPNIQAELREASVKGALRFWYRAIDPDYLINEARIFGGSGKGEGQSLFLLRISGRRTAKTEWILDKQLQYLAFPFKMKQNKRYLSESVKEDENLLLTLLFKDAPENSLDRKRIIASLWLLGHFGGLGSRSRRGFGTIALLKWKAQSGTWDEMTELPILHKQSTPENWNDTLKQALQVLKAWFPGDRIPDHAIFNSNSRFKLVETAENDNRAALKKAAALMQKFRSRRNIKDQDSDYHRVKAHYCYKDKKAGDVGRSLKNPVVAKELKTTIDRAAFGLPLTINYSSLGYKQRENERGPIFDRNGNPVMYPVGTTYEGTEHTRSASRIHIRIVKIRDNFYPLFIRMDGPLLATNEKLKGKKWGTFAAPTNQILDDFWTEIKTDLEVVW